MRSFVLITLSASAGCASKLSEGDIDGQSSGWVGEIVTIVSSGELRSKAGDLTRVGLQAYDGAHLIGEIRVIDLDVDGGVVRADLEEEGSSDDLSISSNALFVEHEGKVVTYTATAEVVCAAAGAVQSGAGTGLEWWYDNARSGGSLSKDAFGFDCVATGTTPTAPTDTGTYTPPGTYSDSGGSGR